MIFKHAFPAVDMLKERGRMLEQQRLSHRISRGQLQYISGCPSNYTIRNEHLRIQLGTGSRSVRNHTSQKVANEHTAYDEIGGRVEVIHSHTNLCSA
jgi:hypothetical protein